MPKRVKSIAELEEKSISDEIIERDLTSYDEFDTQDDYDTPDEDNDIESPFEDDDLTYEVEVKKGELQFGKVEHSKRGEKFKSLSDGEMGKYANVALRYFNNRCALSGEKFIKFDEKVSGKKSNLSAEHVVALCLGGNDIIPNIVPSVLQYNIQKNGYNTIDWWKQARDINGKQIYSSHRLLKIINFMLKSLIIRKEFIETYNRFPTPEEYSERLLAENNIDKYLAEVENHDEEIENNTERKILSDTITATTLDIDQKKILTQIPSLERGIPTAKEQSQDNIKYTENQFLFDAIGEIRKDKELEDIIFEEGGRTISLLEHLENMYKIIEPVIPFENKVRIGLVNELEKLNIENEYSVAQSLLRDSTILERVRENRGEIEKVVREYFKEKIVEISKEYNLTEINSKFVLAYMPDAIYDEEVKKKLRRLIFFQKEIECTLEEILSSRADIQINQIMELEEWCKEKYEGKPVYIRRMPRTQIEGVKVAKEGEKETEDQREVRIGKAIKRLREKYKDKKEEELTVAEKALLKKLEEIEEQYDVGLETDYKKIMELEEWCKEKYEGKPVYIRRMPRTGIGGVKVAKEGEKETEDQRELRIGLAIKRLRVKYKDKKEEELTVAEKALLKKLEEIEKQYTSQNSKAQTIMKKSVGKQVKSNSATRAVMYSELQKMQRGNSRNVAFSIGG